MTAVQISHGGLPWSALWFSTCARFSKRLFLTL
jgi:hypothetical protein